MATNYKIDNGVLVVVIEGIWSLAAEKEVTRTAVGLMESESLSCLLLNFQKATKSQETDNTVHIYEATRDLAVNYPKGTKIAVVYDADGARPDDVRFFDNVAHNWGINAQAFPDTRAAKEWLQ